MSTSLFRNAGGRLADAADQALRWWLREFTAVMPGWFVRALIGGGARSFTIAMTASGVEVASGPPSGRAVFDASSPEALADFINVRRALRGGARFGLELAAEDGFVRTLVVPAAARKALPGVLAQDLLYRTPFSDNLVYHDHVIEPVVGDGSRYRVRHIVVRKDIVDGAATRIGLEAEDIDFVAIPVDDGLLPVRLRNRNDTRRLGGSEAVLSGVAIAFFLATFAAVFIRQSIAIDRLYAENSAMRPAILRAQATKARADAVAATLTTIETRKRAPGVAAILEALTIMIPDDGWLQTIQMNELANARREVMVVGYSADAAGLITAFDRSGSFTDAALTSEVAFDSVKRRERFSLRAFVKAAGIVAERPIR